MNRPEYSFENDFPSEEEALLAPVIWAEVWAYAGQISKEYMLPAANNVCLAIKFPDSDWINPRLRDLCQLLIAEVVERIPSISYNSLEYIGDYVSRVIFYYARNPKFIPEQSPPPEVDL